MILPIGWGTTGATRFTRPSAANLEIRDPGNVYSAP